MYQGLWIEYDRIWWLVSQASKPRETGGKPIIQVQRSEPSLLMVGRWLLRKGLALTTSQVLNRGKIAHSFSRYMDIVDAEEVPKSPTSPQILPSQFSLRAFWYQSAGCNWECPSGIVQCNGCRHDQAFRSVLPQVRNKAPTSDVTREASFSACTNSPSKGLTRISDCCNFKHNIG